MGSSHINKIDMKNTIIVGIPAHNEEKAVKKTIQALLSQKIEEIALNQIIVYSDGSTDQTNNTVKKIINKKVSLIATNTRKGKTHAIKQLLNAANEQGSEFLIIVDADLTIDSDTIIKRLYKKITADKNLIAVSGYRKPLQPKNLIQKIGYFGYFVWNYIVDRSGKRQSYFRSSDSLIILRVNEYPQEKINHFSYMHDEFYYLYAKKYKKHFNFDANIFAYYTLPATLRDYINQMTRYVSRHFTKREQQLLGTGYSVSIKERMKALAACMKGNYRIALLYFLLQSYIQIKSHFLETAFNDTWIQILSTK